MIAVEIRAALLSRGIMLIDIARKCHVSKGLVSNVVAGRRKSERIQLVIAAELGQGMEIWEMNEALGKIESLNDKYTRADSRKLVSVKD